MMWDVKQYTKGEISMTKARRATTTVTFVDEYAERYQDLFPDVRSFEAFTYLLVGMLSDIKRKTLPAIAKAVGADAQALHHLVAYAPWSVHELRRRRLRYYVRHSKRDPSFCVSTRR